MAALLWLLAGLLVAKAAPDRDPFAPANEAKPLPAPPGLQPLPAREPPTAKRIAFEVSVSPQEVRRGETFVLTIKGTLKPGFHTYPLTERSADPAQPPDSLSMLAHVETPGLKPLWPINESESEWHTVPNVGTLLQHEKPFTWKQDVLVLPDATPGPRTLRFRIKLQVCDRTCVYGTHRFDVPLTVTSAPPVALTAQLQQRLELKEPQPKVVPVPNDVPRAEPSPASTVAPSGSGQNQQSLLGLLLTSSLAALGMLLTPCVFPMIPITVSFFLKQSEKEHHNPLLTAGIYSITIVIVLAAAVLLLGGLIVQWANSAWLNAVLGVLLVIFALSLFGMYELELPSFLSQFTAAREGQGGYLGAFFMALTFTITSFTCTGPFLGPLLVAAKELNLSLSHLVLASLAYSATFAFPFFILALFPTLLKALPKSGGWLNAVKVVMGFLELAAALKFLANTDLGLHPGNAWIFNYDTVLCAWIALSVACGLYLIGVFRLPHDSPVEHIGVSRMVLASIFFGLAVYMTPALWREVPLGIVGKGLVAFLPLDTRPASVASGGRGDATELTWHRDYAKAWEEANRDGKLLFIDFTGVNCTNCRANEKGVFPLPAVRQELAKYVRVQLYTDSVPDSSLSSSESARQAQRNSAWERETFGEASNPLYVILRPDKDQPEADGKLKGVALGRYAGYIDNSERFVEFLRDPQKAQVVQSEGGAKE